MVHNAGTGFIGPAFVTIAGLLGGRDLVAAAPEGGPAALIEDAVKAP